jgi:chromosome segregation ATPase
MGVKAIYENYKGYFLVGLICFIVGYGCSLFSSGKQLSNLRIRAEEYQKGIGQYQAREAEFDRRFDQVQIELGRSRAEADGFRKEAGRLRAEINRLSKPLGEARSGIDSAIGHAERIEDSIERIERILSTVQKRGRR